MPGQFTFEPNGGTGVARYVYSLNGGAETIVGAGTPQAERLTPSQQQVTDLTGFSGFNATLSRATDRGHGSSQSLRIAPAATQATACGAGCVFARWEVTPAACGWVCRPAGVTARPLGLRPGHDPA